MDGLVGAFLAEDGGDIGRSRTFDFGQLFTAVAGYAVGDDPPIGGDEPNDGSVVEFADDPGDTAGQQAFAPAEDGFGGAGIEDDLAGRADGAANPTVAGG